MQVEGKGRQYHSSFFDTVPGSSTRVFNKARYDILPKELKGHAETCAWEGYISPEACGCTKFVAPVLGKKSKK